MPMAVHPNVKKVLIIGGGDGGVAKELSYYPEIEEIEVVEQDEMFMEVCQKFFPDMAQGLQDPRVKIYHEDGLRFLRRRISEYDLIINDSTNPFGYTEGLFTKEFYGSCYKALKEDGIMVYQHGSPFYDEDEAALPQHAPQGVPQFSHQPGLPGPYHHLSGGILALWIRVEKVSSDQRFRRCALAQTQHKNLVLHSQSPHRGLHAAQICGRFAGRGGR